MAQTISTFKTLATLTHDNSEAASKEWGRTWGMSYWRNLWRYKEYTATTPSGRTLVYRTGKYYMRHYSDSHTEYLLDGKEVKKTAFLKAFSNIMSTEGIKGRQESPRAVAVVVAPARPRVAQLTLF